MGLFDRFKKAAPAAVKVAPVPVEAHDGAGVVCAPVSGTVVALADVPDPVFSSGAMGPGCGIAPECDVVYAPVSGTVSALMEGSCHALGITSDEGADLIVHVGLDTVSMGGTGFSYLVSEGQHVVAGQPALTFDREAIATAGHPDTVLVVVTNADELGAVSACAEGAVAAGEPLVRIAG